MKTTSAKKLIDELTILINILTNSYLRDFVEQEEKTKMDKDPKDCKYSIQVVMPKHLSECASKDLRLSYVTLKNASSVIIVQMMRIQKELERRGEPTSIFRAIRAKEEEKEVIEQTATH
jgi:hypothetical protein